jgi:hypothetical protein
MHRRVKKTERKHVDTHEQCTQSRMAQIGSEVNEELKDYRFKSGEYNANIIKLKDAGKQGYIRWRDHDEATIRLA